MNNANAAAKAPPIVVYNVFSLAEKRLDAELDVALERSAGAKGVERSVVWWRAAGL